MLEALKFVQGAVAKKDFVPALTHFRIQGRTIRGFNGNLAISSPIDLDLDIHPKATSLVKAIQACEGTIQLSMTPAGKLSVKSGPFRALVECLQEPYPEVLPEGEIIQLTGGLVKVLAELLPFIAEDASRPWARGILFRGQSAFATNNVVLVEKWMGTPFPVEVNIPKSAVVELVRIGEEPVAIQLTEASATFHYGEGRWLRTQLYSTGWPDLSRILNQTASPSPFPQGFWEAVETLGKFVDQTGRMFFRPGLLSTSLAEGEGAAVEVPGLAVEACYHHGQLSLLQDVAQVIDFRGGDESKPPAMFFGEMLRGAIIGMRY